MTNSRHSQIKQFQSWLNQIEAELKPQRSPGGQREIRENVLLAKGEYYSKKISQAREQKDLDFVRCKQDLKHPFHPIVNQRASTPQSSANVEERLIRAGEIYKQRIQQRQEEKKRLLEDQENSFQSATPKKSTTPDLLQKYGDLYRARADDREKAHWIAEQNSLSSPSLAQGTVRLLQNIKREGKVEDRLLRAGMAQREKVEQIHQQVLHRHQGQPKITAQANSLKRVGDVGTRLFSDAKKFSLQRDMTETRVNFSFTPTISPRKDRSFESNRDLNYSYQQDQNHPFSPEISQNSREIARKLETPVKRLLTPRKERPVPEIQYSFKPTINKHPPSTQKQNKSPRWETLYQLHKHYQEKRSNMMENTPDVEPECTFQPKTTSNRESKPQETIQRLNQWAESKSQKIQRIREEITRESTEKFTFSPTIHEAPGRVSPSVYNYKGVDKFLQRQQLAKQRYQQTPSNSSQSEKLFTFGKIPLRDLKQSVQVMNANDFLEAVKSLHNELHSIDNL